MLCKYTYDAWGKHTITDAQGKTVTAENIGNKNPYRYRGYYYDTEFGLYYLQSRYYDPETGRFINADDVSYISPGVIGGLNLFSYCGNNPVMSADHLGTSWENRLWFVVENGIGFLKDISAGISGALLSSGKSVASQLSKMSMYIADNVGGAIFNPAFMSGMNKYTNLLYSGKILNVASKIAAVMSGIFLGIDIGMSLYNNFTNSELSLARKITDSVVDVSYILGTFIASAKLGALVGNVIPIPIVGAIVGAVVAIIINAGAFAFQQSKYYQDIKDGFYFVLVEAPIKLVDIMIDAFRKIFGFNIN